MNNLSHDDLDRESRFALIDDFEASVVGEMTNPENMCFVLCAEDCAAYAEYSDWLTIDEMRAAFRRAERRAR